MFLQALNRYAQSHLADQLAQQAFEERSVPYCVEVDAGGEFVGIVERVEREERTDGKRHKASARVSTLLVARSPENRNAGTKPLLACDAIDYVVGPALGVWTPERELRRHEERHASFVHQIRQAASATGDPALHASVRFYENDRAVAAARGELTARAPRTGTLVALSVRLDGAADGPGTPVIARPAVRDFWRRHYAAKFAERHRGAGQGTCLVSGQQGPLAATHDKIRGLASLGGQAAGVLLVSANKPAFASYGWEKSANCPISPDAAQAYVLALNDLLRPGRHRPGWSPDGLVSTRRDFGGVAFVYWSREAPYDWAEAIEAPNSPSVAEMLGTPLSGEGHRLDADDELAPFHLAALSANGGRLVVRDWHTRTVDAVRRNLRNWRDELALDSPFDEGTAAPMPRLSELLRAVSPPGVEASDARNAEHAMQMVRRAFFGRPAGRALLAAALGRARVARGAGRLAPVRNGLIRLCVNDIVRNEEKGKPLMERLDPHLAHPAYLCGRLFAIYEGLQYSAFRAGAPSNSTPGPSVTVGDRYFTLASTFPQAVFPRLESLGKAHLKKLRRENPRAMSAIAGRITTLTSHMGPDGYPGQLSLQDQGRFIVGYHHQKAEEGRQAALARAAREAAGSAAPAESTPAEFATIQ